MTALAPCLTCRQHLAHTRGCCPKCYRRHGAAVRARQTTWSALEVAGLALPARPAPAGWRHWDINP